MIARAERGVNGQTSFGERLDFLIEMSYNHYILINRTGVTMSAVEQLEKYRKADGFIDVDAIHADQGTSLLDSAFDMFFSEGQYDDFSGESELVQLAYAENERVGKARHEQPVYDAIEAGDFQLYEDGRNEALIVLVDGYFHETASYKGAREFRIERAGRRVTVPRPATSGRADLRERMQKAIEHEAWMRTEAERDPEGAFGGRGSNAVL